MNKAQKLEQMRADRTKFLDMGNAYSQIGNVEAIREMISCARHIDRKMAELEAEMRREQKSKALDAELDAAFIEDVVAALSERPTVTGERTDTGTLLSAAPPPPPEPSAVSVPPVSSVRGAPGLENVRRHIEEAKLRKAAAKP